MKILVLTLLPLMVAASLVYVFCACTLSYQNISTHGVADDLVDENQAASPTVDPVVSPTVSIPVKPL